jgi:DNA-binding response OmpR family regulator
MACEGRKTILVVEDSPKIRPLIERILEDEGYRILTAEGAEQAQRILDSGARIDLLLADLILPGASGIELARRLNRRSPETKVLFMSGLPVDVGPGSEFIAKPFLPAELLERVGRLLA